MLNRRHLRIKVLQGLYAHYQADDSDVLQIEKGIFKSIERMHDLYLRLLLVFPELKHQAILRMEEAKQKVLPTEDDLNPNTKFIDNELLALIESNTELRRLAEMNKLNWQGEEEQEIFKKLFNQIRKSDVYKEYMSDPFSSFDSDKSFMVGLFKEDIANFDLLQYYFEESSIFWNDDLDLSCLAVVKTLNNFEKEKGERNKIQTLYKDEVDEVDFVKQVYRKTIQDDDENTKLIDQLTKNWEVDRIARLDVIMMKMALTELKHFSEIPKKVSLNEYIDISKYYSTPKSKIFINGVLDKAVDILEKEGKIIKKGRGLIQ